ncbi:phage tail protein [Pseudomonas uvaldensis]|uniref:phage tail protein n=1 Tax=Pseudomonas uvaldensis TaxID=2878385 RepID=UPI001E3D5398|nr:phage tail protein [Pseudomonas uvaldensis]MCE0459953.1 phage tail protein [Pseudomonas uvaldensis]
MVDKNTIFGGMLTTLGANKKTNCDALGIPWEPKYMLIGDANGTDPVPSASQTKLINQVYRAQLNQLRVSDKDPNVLIAELVLPPDVGGWWIRELALEDKDGVFCAVSNVAPSYKPLLEQNSGRNQVVRMHIITNGTSNIQLKIDPSVVLATREYVDTRIQEELYKLDNKQSVRVATTGNIVLTGLQTIDGVSLLAGDRVLVKSQTLAKDNGIYIVGVGAWQRAPDADSSAEVTSALILSVEQGVTQADTRWQLITDGAIVLGTTALTFQNVTQGYAPINSPAFQGSPTAPTAPLSNSSQLLANTAFVQRALGNHSGIGVISATTVLTSSAFGQSFIINSASPINITLPLGVTGFNGGTITFTNVSSGAATIILQGTDYVAGMAENQLVLKTMDTITLSTGAGTVWYAEDGSVRDVLSTTFKDLMAGKLSIGQFGLGVDTAPTLPTFKAITPGGLYRAYGAQVQNSATPWAPPESGNRLLGVFAISPRDDATYYLALEHAAASADRRMWVGQYTSGTAEVLWSYLMTSEFQASQSEAEVGTNPSKWMSPLRVAQAIATKLVQATEAVLGFAKVATQAQTNAGADDATMVTPKKLRWGFVMSLGINGSIVFPTWLGSFIFQWGVVTMGTGTVHAYPMAFPNNCFFITPGLLPSPSSGTEFAQIYEKSLTDFKGWAYTDSGSRTGGTVAGVGWWAFGN